MTDGERLALSGEILRFMGAMATEIRSLSNNVDNMDNNAQTHFYKQVSSYLYQVCWQEVPHFICYYHQIVFVIYRCCGILCIIGAEFIYETF